jgi:hypothetical protein
MITWVLYLCIGVIIGGMAGFYFAKLDDFSRKQKQELEEKLHQSERELVEYKDQVTTHFKETAILVNNMTESYQKVHEHLAQGSVELCNNAVEVNKLTVSSNQLLSSTSPDAISDVEKTTSLTESEAPKNRSTENTNKNKVETSAVTEDASRDEELVTELTESLAPNSQNQSQNQPHDEPQNQAEDPVLETMAVAEEDSTEESEEKDKSKARLPGSRMVH